MRLRKGWQLAMLSTLTLAAGASAKVEDLGQPCRAKNILAGLVVKDPNSDRHWLVLTNQNEATNAELLFIDYAKNTGEAVRAPAGAGSWALNEVPGNRLVVGTYYDGMFMVYDLAKREWVKTVKFPGEDYIWNQAIGKDGRLYGGTYPGGKLGALDLTTYTVEDCGAPAKPNLYLRYVSPTPDGRILCQFGMEKPARMIYDPATKQFTPAPPQLSDVTMGTVWNGYFLAGGHAYKGEDFAEVTPPPFPLPQGAKDWTVLPQLTSPDVLYFSSGGSLYRYTKGDKAPVFITNASLHGGGFTAAAPDDSVLSVRGQDYAWIHPGDRKVTYQTIPAESAPRPTHFLRIGPKGRLWGGPTFGQTVFYLDPKTKDVVNTGKVSDNGGEVYDAAFVGDDAYFVSYAGGEIIRFNPEKPFDQFNRKNPVTIATVGPDYIRPAGGITVGPDGKLYSGWMVKYGAYGGALAITDPKTGKTDLIKDPLGAMTVHGVAVDARNAYIGTSLEANGLPNKPNATPEFGVIDLATRQVTFRHPFPGSGAVHQVRYDPVSKRVAMLVSGQPVVYDTVAGQLLPDLTKDAPKATGPDAAAPGDGFYYYGSENNVMALDLRTGGVLPVAELPARVEHLEAAPDGAIYVSCGVDVYRAREAR